jgi:16S rRNA processing protein RimM
MELAYVGYFSKVHGIKGQLVLRLEHDFLVDEVNALFIETTTGKAPYYISDIKENKSGLIMSLEELDTVEKARSLTGKKVFVDSKFMIEEEEDFNWIGYELIDKSYGSIGKISELTNNGVQLLITVSFNGKEIILPLVEDFIERIDEAEKKLFFNAPEGLIDVYLDDKE